MNHKDYAQTGRILKSYLCGSRILTLLLVFLPLLFSYAAAASNQAVLQTSDQLTAYIAENQGNLLLGSIGDNTIAAVTIWRIRLSTEVIISVISIVMMINITRRDEDNGKLELIRAGAVGVKAPLAAAFILLISADLLGGLMMSAGFIASGFPLSGSLTAGLSTAFCALFFTGIAAVSAQLAPDAQLSRRLSFAAMAFFLIVELAANASGNEYAQLLTPFEWCGLARPFAGENYWVFIIASCLVLLLVFAAFYLHERRDFGGSYFHERSAREYGGRYFNNPFALAWRQEKGSLLLWIGTYALMGLVISSLRPTIDNMLEGTAFLPELAATVGGPGRAFLAILSYILAQIVTAYLIMTVLHLRSEEASARTEWLLSKPVSRLQYSASTLLIAYLGSAAAVAVFGLCSGEFITSISRIPAVWLLGSVTFTVYGFAPRLAAPVGWSAFGLSLLIEFLWEMRFVNNGIFKLSPFAWVYPGTEVSITVMITMLILTALLLGIGLKYFENRDILSE